MSLSTRELYLALRVRDEGTRNLQRFASELTRTGTVARIATIRAQADALREQASLKRGEIAIKRVELARLRENGASQAQIRGMTSRIAEMSKEAAAMEREAKQFDQQATLIQRNADRLNHLTGTMTQTGVVLQTLGVAFAALGVAGVAAMNNLVQGAIEYERQVRLTATQIDNFGGNLDELAEIGKNTAKRFAVPFMQVQTALFEIFSSMEVSVAGATTLVEAFAKAAVAGQTDIINASRATIGIMNAFTIPVEQVNKVLDLQFQLVQEGIGSYEEWTARIGSVSPSAVRATQSLEMMLAALAASTRFGIPAAQSATAVARAFDAFSNPTAVDRMEELGIAIRDADGGLRPFNLVIREFRDVLRGMPEHDRVDTILDVFRGAGSTIQARKFLQTLLLTETGLETLDLILSEMTGDTGAFENAYAMMADTTAMKSQVLANKWAVVREEIGERLLPAFNSMLGFLERIVDWFDRLPESTKDTIAKTLLWGSAILIAGGAILVLIGFLAVFIASVISAGAVLGTTLLVISGIIAALVGLGAAFGIAWAKSKPFRDIITDIYNNTVTLGRGLVEVGRRIGRAFQEHLQPPLSELGKLINEDILPAFREFQAEVWDRLRPKLEEAGRIIVSAFKVAFQALGWVVSNIVVPALRMLSEWWQDNKAKLWPIIELFIQIGKYIAIAAGIIVAILISAAFMQLIYTVGLVVAAFVLIITTISAVYDAILWIWNGIKWIGNKISGTFTGVKRTAGDTVASLKNFFTVSIPNFFSGIGNWLYDTGKDFIRGFIRGMKNMFGQGIDEIKNWGRNLLKGLTGVLGISSPSRQMMEIGRQSALGYVLGYRRTLADEMAGTNAFLGLGVPEFAPREQARVGGAEPRSALTPASPSVTKNITNNITVNTHELDAREQAARLGWELAGRM